MSNPAMQTRCIHCGLEQYAPAVWELSTKGGSCPWCGERIVTMSEEEYRIKLREHRERKLEAPR